MSSTISPMNQVPTGITAAQNVQNQPPIPAPDEIMVPPPEEQKEGSNLLLNTLTGLALLGTATYLGYNLFKRGGGNNFEKTLEAFKQQGGKFERGIAKCADDTLFNGVIKHTDKAGNTYYRQYVNGKLQMARKNIDIKNFPDKNLTDNYNKIYNYNAEGKLTKIEKEVLGTDLSVTRSEIIPNAKNVKTMEKFTADGGKFAEGKPLNADGTDFKGFIVEKSDEGNTLIKEYADGKQVSERLNTTLKDNVMNTEKEHYILDEAGLIKRELERIAHEQERIAHEKEINSISYKFKTWFKNLFSRKPKTEPEAPVELPEVL